MRQAREVCIDTARGPVRGLLHAAPGARHGAVLIGDGAAGRGVQEPLYEELALYLRSANVAVFQLWQPQSTPLAARAYEALAAVATLADDRIDRVALVEWSVGIAAASIARHASVAIPGVTDIIAGVATIVHPAPAEPPWEAAPRLRLVRAADAETAPAWQLPSSAADPTELVLFPRSCHTAPRGAQSALLLETLYGWVAALLRRQPRPDATNPPAAWHATPVERRELRRLLDREWAVVMAALEGRDPQRAADVRAMLAHPATAAGPRSLPTAAIWLHLDYQSRCDWLQRSARVWRVAHDTRERDMSGVASS